MAKSYHNTNKESGEVLLSSEEKAKTQEQVVYEFMEKWYNTEFTAEDISREVIINAPLTSCRRALTNLMNEGKIFKTNNTKDGMYGKKIFTYKYKFIDKLF